MATAKSSRSRVGHSGILQSNGMPGGAVASTDTTVQLTDMLQIFKSESFDPDGYVQSKCQTMSEKEIRHLCSHLQDLKRASAEEMRKSVYANYAAFIRTSKEISDLEGELLSIRNLLSTQAALIHGLAEGVHVESLSSADSNEDEVSHVEDKEPSDIERWALEFPDILDVLLAERRVDEALAAFDEGEKIVSAAKEKESLNQSELSSLQAAIADRRRRLADQLADAASQSSTRGVELRAAASALKRLGDAARAHHLILTAHGQRLHHNLQTIHPASTSYGGAYTAVLSQQVFSAIAQAVNDSQEVFGSEGQAHASELVIWATKKTETLAHLVKRHALASSAAAGGLRAAAECVQIAMGHCSLLESQGLLLSSVLVKAFRPSIEQALDTNLKRIEERTAALVAADDWTLAYTPLIGRSSGRAPATTSAIGNALQPKLSSSAQRFHSMVQDFFEDVGPLLSMQLGGSTLDGILRVFNSYTNLLIKALPGSLEEEANLEGAANKIVKTAETEPQQLALLANASFLADELLPRGAMKLYQSGQVDPPSRATDRKGRFAEQREWKEKLQREVERLRTIFCRQHALDLIFTEEGDSLLSADMYLNMDGSVDESTLTPSPIFQDLFAKLHRMAGIASEMFIGRERFAMQLLTKLTETVILWLSNDQSFWDDIEEGHKPLGPIGLVQFYLDMKFVAQFATQNRLSNRRIQNRLSSRLLNQVIGEVIERAIVTFSATGIDPNTVLYEDTWFESVANETIQSIRGASGEREINSPTASVSAQSISSVRSLGST
ncbi:exocyst complex component 84B [Wolffia australiana]